MARREAARKLLSGQNVRLSVIRVRFSHNSCDEKAGAALINITGSGVELPVCFFRVSTEGLEALGPEGDTLRQHLKI